MSSTLPAARIGITQRRLPAGAGSPARDALDAQWYGWFAKAWPSASYVAIPNDPAPAAAPRFVERWGIDVLLLSGGEDVGTSPDRDRTEQALVEMFRLRRLPVIGVCRGMQLLHCSTGGALVKTTDHVGTPHAVRSKHGAFRVNSWHRHAIREVTADWHVLASATDGTVEAMRRRAVPWLAVMWHPERDDAPPAIVETWLRELLDGDEAE